MGHYALDLVDLQQKCDNFNRSSWSFLLSKQKERKRHKSSLTNNFYGHEKWCHINENAWKNLHCSIPFRYVALRSIQNVLWELTYIHILHALHLWRGPLESNRMGDTTNSEVIKGIQQFLWPLLLPKCRVCAVNEYEWVSEYTRELL